MFYFGTNSLSSLWSKIKSNFATKKTLSVTLTSSGWSQSGDVYAQTVSVPGVTINSIVIVSSSLGNVNVYGEYGIKCVSQSSGSLTFNADSVPNVDIVVNILNLGEEI